MTRLPDEQSDTMAEWPKPVAKLTRRSKRYIREQFNNARTYKDITETDLADVCKTKITGVHAGHALLRSLSDESVVGAIRWKASVFTRRYWAAVAWYGRHAAIAGNLKAMTLFGPQAEELQFKVQITNRRLRLYPADDSHLYEIRGVAPKRGSFNMRLCIGAETVCDLLDHGLPIGFLDIVRSLRPSRRLSPWQRAMRICTDPLPDTPESNARVLAMFVAARHCLRHHVREAQSPTSAGGGDSGGGI